VANEVIKRMPWDPVPVEETLRLLQLDFGYAVSHTAVAVHSDIEELQLRVNTLRGQIVPRGECKFTGGHKIEFQDIGMPQPGLPTMTVPELIAKVWEVAEGLGLEVVP
jgi:hypothetical protein